MKWPASVRREGRGSCGRNSCSCTEYRAVSTAAALQSVTAKESSLRAAACSCSRSAIDTIANSRTASGSGDAQLWDAPVGPAL
jgi:hypothetical protein